MEKASTSLSFQSSPDPATIGQNVVLTATVSSTAGVPSSKVIFNDGSTVLGTVALINGTAQLTTSFSANGTHRLTANFSPTVNFSKSSALFAEDVGTNQIQHIVIVVQENRTPDNLFHGLPGADIANTGINSKGDVITLQPIALASPYGLGHGHPDFLAMYDNGAMDGADLIGVSCAKKCPPNPQFMYVDPSDVEPYFQLAEQYTFGDRMFQSNQGGSFPAHQYVISGTSALCQRPLRRLFCRGKSKTICTDGLRVGAEHGNGAAAQS